MRSAQTAIRTAEHNRIRILPTSETPDAVNRASMLFVMRSAQTAIRTAEHNRIRILPTSETPDAVNRASYVICYEVGTDRYLNSRTQQNQNTSYL